MNRTYFGYLVGAVDGDGFGLVAFSDQQRRTYFDPLRFAAPWPVPTDGSYLAVTSATPQWQALWLIRQGAPIYVYGGA